MPKLRQTCTRCSLRRQKCDRQLPCNRCVGAGAGGECSRTWPEKYDPSIYRKYPKSRPQASPRGSRSHPSRRLEGSPFVTAVTRSPTNHCGHGARDEGSNGDLKHLLPSVELIHTLIDYHTDRLAWYHGSFSGPLFRTQLTHAFSNPERFEAENLGPRQLALFFAVLCASATCSDQTIALSWGYIKTSKIEMAKAWYTASMASLNNSRYMATPHIHSIQTILILGLSAHLLGYSSELFTLFGVATRLAQCLGLHKLSYDSRLDDLKSVDRSHRDICLQRELGRRVWAQLRAYDGCSVAVLGMWVTLRPDRSPLTHSQVHLEFSTSDHDHAPKNSR